MTENAPTTRDVDRSESESDSASESDPASESTPPRGDGFETRVEDSESVAATCAYCERPFASAAAHDLHVGEAHADVCTDVEREAYETALAAEEDELFYFHLRVVAALAGLYTVVVLAYMIALGSGLL